MKALVIAPQPFFSYRGTPLSVYYRTLVTAELGLEVDLLTYGEGQDVYIPGVRIVRIPRFKFLGSVKIGPSLLKLFLDCFILLWTIGLLIKNKYKFVQAHEEAVFICYFLKPIFKFKLVYDMHSSLPEQLTNFKFTQSKLLIGIFKALERACLHSADAILTVCPSLYHYAKQSVGDQKLILLIENSIFEDIKLKIEPPQVRCVSQELLQKRFIVYAGTLEPYQGIHILIQAFQYVLKHEPDLLLLVIGGTQAQVQYYSALAETFNIAQHCTFTGNVSPNVARRFLNQAAVQVSCRVSGTNAPLKVYEMLARGIPIVATDIYSHTQVLNEEVAFLVEPDPRSMAVGILEALNSTGEARRKVAAAKRLYEQQYSRKIYKDKMRELFEYLQVGDCCISSLELTQSK